MSFPLSFKNFSRFPVDMWTAAPHLTTYPQHYDYYFTQERTSSKLLSLFCDTIADFPGCLYCSSKECLNGAGAVLNFHSYIGAYGLCVCRRDNKYFIKEMHLNKADALHACIFCTSTDMKEMEVLEQTPKLTKIKTSCGQCLEQTIISVDGILDEKKKVLAKMLEGYGIAKCADVQFSHEQIKKWRIPKHSFLYLCNEIPKEKFKNSKEIIEFLERKMLEAQYYDITSVFAKQVDETELKYNILLDIKQKDGERITLKAKEPISKWEHTRLKHKVHSGAPFYLVKK